MATGALVEEVAEEVALNLEEAANVTRKIDSRGAGFFLVGLGVGLGVGFYFGYRFNREKIRAELFVESEKEISAIRETYQRKIVAAEDKKDLSDIIEERGYSTDVDAELEPPRLLKPPVVVTPLVHAPVPEPWDQERELASRNSDRPYVISQEEFNDTTNSYGKTVYTYWAGDDVLTDSDNSPIMRPQNIVGHDNLKFGHGTDDVDVVFIRNDDLSLEIEICRDYRSYEEVILGNGPEPEAVEVDEADDEDGLRHSSQHRPAPRQPKKRHH